MSSPTPHVSRRALAWSAPMVLASASIPAYAASTREKQPAVSGNGHAYHNSDQDANYDGSKRYWLTTFDERNPYSVAVYFTIPTDIITNVAVTYWLPEDNLQFTSVKSNGWATPTRDYTQGNVVTRQGITEYAYTSYYQGSLAARKGTTPFPSYLFVATGQDDRDWSTLRVKYRYKYTATVNGQESMKSPDQYFYRPEA
ncbi:hypothetical protein [Rothia sp. P4278]|uniref:hypothetical protein n=1 Tax=Rothia sp. P4278 TaxID=3402658 RepID=UPI003AE6DC8D